MSVFRTVLEKIKNINSLYNERGSILVLTALLLPIMFGCLGIAYDVGNIYIHKARLQNVTDAAALAGGRAYLQSQLKTGDVHIDTYDTYTNGNVTDVEYVVGSNGGISTTRDGHHPDADIAADKYIRNNIINLGEKVYSDKYSHYALRGLKKVGEDYVYDSKIFYRIGLFEKVPLHFLPVITNKNIETVRAGSVVVIEPGTPGSGGNNPTPSTDFSIFGNLFTYSETFTSNQHNNALNDTHETYTGRIVFTHGNDESGFDDSGNFYNTNETGHHTTNHLFTDEENEKVINDPLIDTSIKTTAYIDAFKRRLYKIHIENDENQNFRFNSNDLKMYKYHIPNSGHAGDYFKCNDDYYPYDPSTGDFSIVTDADGKEYAVCYHLSRSKWQYVLCGKKIGDTNPTRYYLLSNNKSVTDCYLITENGNEQWFNSRNDLYAMLDQNAFNNATKQEITNLSSNVIHIHNNQYDRISNLNIFPPSNLPGDGTKPIYVIVEENVKNTINFKPSGNNNVPIIFVYLGTANIYFNPENCTEFKGTIYAPYAEFQNNYKGTFIGNIVAKSIVIPSSQRGHWVQYNYLNHEATENDSYNYRDDYVAEVTPSATYTDDIKEQVKNQWVKKWSNGQIELDIKKENIGDMSWYNNLSYDQKQYLYTIWKDLRKNNSKLKDVLFPWDDRFNINTGNITPPTPGTPETLRLINYRTEFQLKENMNNDDVVDPFIIETLRQPNSY